MLLTSTSEVYGDPEVHPQKETYWGHVNPIGTYGHTYTSNCFSVLCFYFVSEHCSTYATCLPCTLSYPIHQTHVTAYCFTTFEGSQHALCSPSQCYTFLIPAFATITHSHWCSSSLPLSVSSVHLHRSPCMLWRGQTCCWNYDVSTE